MNVASHFVLLLFQKFIFFRVRAKGYLIVMCVNPTVESKIRPPPPIFLIEMVSLKTFSSLSVCVYLCVCDVCQLDNGGPSAGSECVDNKSSRLNAGLITSQEC